jgi:DNA-binding transcriptional MerR regulator
LPRKATGKGFRRQHAPGTRLDTGDRASLYLPPKPEALVLRDSSVPEPSTTDSTHDDDAIGCPGLLTTGDMARLTGSTLRTVRFYEQEGLLEPATRNGGGHRLFREEERHKLQLILDLREAGLSLQDIRTLLELKRGCPTAEEASQRLSAVLEAQLECMQRKIVLLRRLREELASTVYAISDCRTCKDTLFPHRCHECDVVQQPDLPRALRVLWTD